jgi:hypothetical protein
VNEVAVYPSNGGAFEASTDNVRAMLKIPSDVIDKARAAGYTRVRGQFHFTKNDKVISLTSQSSRI